MDARPDAVVVDAGPPPPPYGADVRSLRLRHSVSVRLEPRQRGGKLLGVIESDTRVAWREAATGPGCPRWIAIAPRGWICDRNLAPTSKPPTDDLWPAVPAGALMPGVYGHVQADGAKTYKSAAAVRADKPARVLAGEVSVKQVALVDVDGKPFWRTQSGELIDAAQIEVYAPSRFHGVHPGQDGVPALPFAWLQSRKDPEAKVGVRAGPERGDDVLRKVKPRTLVPVLAVSADGAALRIGAHEWVRAVDAHVARASDPPPGTAADERWIDVDRDEQVLIAWDGRRPAFATLVSTGRAQFPTPTGIYRVFLKVAETDMSGQMADEQPYSVATVPWTQFFAKDLALHTAYWHDRFGQPRSHGCVNLSPLDARELYFWTAPDVPPGWSAIHGILEAPGTLVRVRSAADPTPAFQGYARRIAEAQGPAAPASAPAEPGEEPVDFPGEDAGR